MEVQSFSNCSSKVFSEAFRRYSDADLKKGRFFSFFLTHSLNVEIELLFLLPVAVCMYIQYIYIIYINIYIYIPCEIEPLAKSVMFRLNLIEHAKSGTRFK